MVILYLITEIGYTCTSQLDFPLIGTDQGNYQKWSEFGA